MSIGKPKGFLARGSAWLLAALLCCVMGGGVALAEPAAENDLPATSDAPAAVEAPAAAEAPAEEGQPLASAPEAQNVYEVTFVPKKNTTTVEVHVPQLATLTSQGTADSLKVVAELKYNGITMRTVTHTYTLAELAQNPVMDFGNYGEFQVSASLTKGGTTIATSNATVAVTAAHYNIASLPGTLPVAYLSTSFWDLNHDGDTPVPTIVTLSRPQSFNWDHLPQGMYSLPYLASPQEGKEWDGMFKMGDYVKDLYRLDPTAKFTMIVNDYHLRNLGNILYANNLPMDQVKVIFISDGSATAAEMSEAYASSNPEAEHAKYLQEWNSITESWKKAGRVTSATPQVDGKYMYAAVCSIPDCEWWVARKSLITSGDNNVFAQKMQNDPKMIQKSIASSLATLREQGHEAEFKALYNFKDDYFSKAHDENKQIMLLLGTHTYAEYHFDAYANLVETFYGDGYVYYYKGHPAYPTALDPAKQQRLKNLGLIDVDSTIPAELILFYYPDAYLTGYTTSTFNSAQSDRKGGVWGQTKESATSSGAEMVDMDWYAAPKDMAPAAIASWFHAGHECYSVEFSDAYLAKQNHAFDFAVYDANDNTLTYYKGSDASAQVVKTTNGGAPKQSAKGTGQWKQDSTGWWYRNADGSYLSSGWKQVGPTWYHFDTRGYMDTSWLKDGNTWYYLGGANDGSMKTSWQWIGGRWYLFDEDGAMLSGWKQDRYAWYYLGGANDGAAKTGWQSIGGRWYHFNGDAAMDHGWAAVGGRWYYLGDADDGSMKTGWILVDGTWYYLDASGAMKTGWVFVDGHWYYLDASGAMRTGWLKLANTWYYLDGSGAMQTGSHTIGGVAYEFDASGALKSA